MEKEVQMEILKNERTKEREATEKIKNFNPNYNQPIKNLIFYNLALDLTYRPTHQPPLLSQTHLENVWGVRCMQPYFIKTKSL